MDEKIIVIIPVHKEIPNRSEIVSLQQCKKVLNQYAVYLVYPSGMNCSSYLDHYPDLLLHPVEPRWLSSLENYNKMKCSIAFYRQFEENDFMLTYELDAFIFSDDWQKANCFNYDYIGAPWFENFGTSYNDTKLKGVGNSGFSMRNIKKCIEVLENKEIIKPYWNLLQKFGLHRFIRLSFLLHFFKSKSWKVNVTNYYFIPFTSEDFISEDIFWGTVIPSIFDFKIASIPDSIKFSFEVHPSLLYEKNQYHLPLGCHAWEKYDAKFWEPYIS